MAPKPQLKPKVIAAKTAVSGAAPSKGRKLPIREKTIAAGIQMHDVTMNTSQMFSHFQPGISFIGAVNSPLQRPDKRA
jgi:hypothetical protein